MFISNTFNFSEREGLNAFSCNDFESVFIELNDLHEGNKIIGAIYRPPGHDTTNFLTCFNSVCNIISKGKKQCILAGDYNIDLFKADTHLDTESFINDFHSHMFLPAITRPTRFGITSSTLIDIFINKPHTLLVSGILITDISDHFPIFNISSELFHKNSTQFLTKTIRMTSSQNIANLKNKLSEIDWTLLERCQDPNAATILF